MAKKLSVDAAHAMSIVFGEYKGGEWAPRNPEALVLGTKAKAEDKTLFEKFKSWLAGEQSAPYEYDAVVPAITAMIPSLKAAFDSGDMDSVTGVMEKFLSDLDAVRIPKAGKRHSAADQDSLDAIAAEHAKLLKNTSAFQKSTAAIGAHLDALKNADPANAKDPDDEDGDVDNSQRKPGDSKNVDDTGPERKADDAGQDPEVSVVTPGGGNPVVNKLYPSDAEADAGQPSSEDRLAVTVMDVPDNYKWPNGYKAFPKDVAEDGSVTSWTLKADAEGKYGDVEYADAKNKKYPVDTEEHARAAWSYINMPKNAAKYEDGELSTIKSKIRAACKKFGIAISDDSSKSGEIEMTKEEVAALVAEAVAKAREADKAEVDAAKAAAQDAVTEAEKAKADAEEAERKLNEQVRKGSGKGADDPRFAKGEDGMTPLQRAVKAANAGSISTVQGK